MLTFELAREAADHLRARRAVERAPLGTFLALLVAAAVQAFAPPARWDWSLGLGLGLLFGPPILGKALPRRNLMGYRLGLVAYPLNALLLAFIVYLQIAGWAFVPPEDFPALARLLPWCGLIAGGVYAVIQAPHWMGRVALYSEVARSLAKPPAPAALAELAMLMDQARQGEGATFRSVPATPRNWSRFLRLDTQVHGRWHVAFAPLYALVFFEDGGSLEAVEKGGLKLVADDPQPGEVTLCLVRWNKHLLEGRIASDDFDHITRWNRKVEPLGLGPE